MQKSSYQSPGVWEGVKPISSKLQIKPGTMGRFQCNKKSSEVAMIKTYWDVRWHSAGLAGHRTSFISFWGVMRWKHLVPHNLMPSMKNLLILYIYMNIHYIRSNWYLLVYSHLTFFWAQRMRHDSSSPLQSAMPFSNWGFSEAARLQEKQMKTYGTNILEAEKGLEMQAVWWWTLLLTGEFCQVAIASCEVHELRDGSEQVPQRPDATFISGPFQLYAMDCSLPWQDALD